jgi:putative membrane protein
MLKRFSTLSILAFMVLSVPLHAIAQQPSQPPTPPQDYYGPGPWHHMWGGGYGWHGWWMFPMILLCMIVFFTVIFFLARALCGHGLCGHGCHHHWGPSSRTWGSDPSYSALQILNERFARGEIQKEEYTDKKATILSGR